MKNKFCAAGIFTAAALLVAGCSSEEPPSELDILIEQLQTSQITSESEPEETSEDVTTSNNDEETTEDVTTPENTEELPDDTAVTESSEETTDVSSVPDDTEETTDGSEETDNNAVTYDSITVTVLSAEEDHISVETGGTVYNISIDENTPILGGTVLEGKIVTITYILTDDGAETDIKTAVITVIPVD